MRDTLLVIHILAAGAWIGTNVVQIVRNPGIGEKGGAIASDWHRALVTFGRIVYMPSALVSLVTGVWLVIDSDVFGFSDAFVSIGFLAVIVGAGMGMGFFAPQNRRAADAYDVGDTAAARAIESKINTAWMIDTTIIVVTVIAMVAKWGV